MEELHVPRADRAPPRVDALVLAVLVGVVATIGSLSLTDSHATEEH